MAEFDAPQSRNEAILQNMLGANNTLPAPQSRIEELLQQILEQGSGGEKKYLHSCKYIVRRIEGQKFYVDAEINALIVNDSPNMIAGSSLVNYIKSLSSPLLNATGFLNLENDKGIVYSLTAVDTNLGVGYYDESDYHMKTKMFVPNELFATDIVYEI
jgi:hypothetical protein